MVGKNNKISNDDVKALELAYTYALTYSSTFNTLLIAVVFGIFSILLLLKASKFLSLAWIFLSIGYFASVLNLLHIYFRTQIYNQMALEAAKRLGAFGILETVFQEVIIESEGLWLEKWMGRKFQTQGFFRRIYPYAGLLFLLILWIVVAIL